MRLIHKQKATVLRQEGQGMWEVDGGYIDPYRVEIPIRCSVQPTFFGSERQKLLPEGVTHRDLRDIYTVFNLQVGSEHRQQRADIVVFNGVEYEVFEVSEWFSATGRLDHYRAVMIRRDVLNGSRRP